MNKLICAAATCLCVGLFLASAPALPQAKAGEQRKAQAYTVTRGIQITMRDGVKLSANLYMPNAAPGRIPTVLMRTPYSKDGDPSDFFANIFAANGYAFLVED